MGVSCSCAAEELELKHKAHEASTRRLVGIAVYWTGVILSPLQLLGLCSGLQRECGEP